ncbi:WG repeat-containing protein [Sporomusa acidovorans]
MDETGKVVIPAQFGDEDDFSEGLTAVMINGKWGFIDKTGK